MSCKFVKTTYN